MTEITKKVLILSDSSKNNLTLSKKIILTLKSFDVKVIFYLENKKLFLDENKEINNVRDLFVLNDIIINLIPVNEDISRKISRELELLKIPTILNSLDNRLIFYSKNNIKRIFSSYNYKTPVFRFLGNKNSDDTFLDFIQPSRIFSKVHNYFSEKIDSLETMEKVFADIVDIKNNCFIEEYIEGDDIYSLIFKKNENIFCYNIKREVVISEKDKITIIYSKLDSEKNNKITELAKGFFQNAGINKFSLIHFKENKRRGVFFLNIFVELDILIKENGEIVNEILEQESVSLKNIFEIG